MLQIRELPINKLSCRGFSVRWGRTIFERWDIIAEWDRTIAERWDIIVECIAVPGLEPQIQTSADTDRERIYSTF